MRRQHSGQPANGPPLEQCAQRTVRGDGVQGIGIEDLGPLVGVVAGGIAASEDVTEGAEEGVLLDRLQHGGGLGDLAAQLHLDALAVLEAQVLGLLLEQVGVEVEVLEVHLRVEQVLLVHVDVHHLVALLDRLGQEVLDRVDLVVDVVLLALHVAGEAAHAVVHHHDVGLEGLDQVVQGLQRRDDAAGGHVDVGAEGGDAVVRVGFRIGVHGDVRLVQVRHHGVGDDLLARGLLVDHRLFGDQDRHRRTLGVVVLAGHVQDVGADDLGHVGQDLGQALGVVGLVDVLDVALALLFRDRVADVVDVEAQRLGEVVETLEPEARQWLDHVGIPVCGGGGARGRIIGQTAPRGNLGAGGAFAGIARGTFPA